MSTVSPQRMKIDDVFQTVEQSGGGPQLHPPEFRRNGLMRLWLRTLLYGSVLMMILEYDRIAGTIGMSEDRVPTRNIESPYGGGVRSLPGATGNLPPVKFPTTPVLLADRSQLGSWQVAVVWVDETPAGDASGWECPRAEQNRQRPIDLSKVAGNVRPVLPAGGPPLADLVNSVGPVGQCGMMFPYAEKIHQP